MGIVKKTKQERESSRDTPLSETPDSTRPVTDLKSALADINTRSEARQKSINESKAKLNAARIERSKNRKDTSGGVGLYGLASFAGTTGKQPK